MMEVKSVIISYYLPYVLVVRGDKKRPAPDIAPSGCVEDAIPCNRPVFNAGNNIFISGYCAGIFLGVNLSANELEP